LTDIWKEAQETLAAGEQTKETNGKRLIISPELTDKLNKLLILESNLLLAIRYCEETGGKILNPEKDCFIGHHKQGHMTYWVSYTVEEDAYRVLNAYCHRLVIEGDGEACDAV
jgi:hypothetical protein